jgi:hypothetical protein
LKADGSGLAVVAGADEVGVGALAEPVVAAAVIFAPWHDHRRLGLLEDA